MNQRETMSFTPIRTENNGDIIYNLRVIPYGELSLKERAIMSCEPRHLTLDSNGWHVSEMPLTFRDNTVRLNDVLVYIYDEMDDMDKALYFDRFRTMEVCVPEVTKLFAPKKKNSKPVPQEKPGKYLRRRKMK